MTGGGPGGATRLFSILAYEKAIVGLRFGPGAATAFSMAPILALVIFVLARVMRPESDNRAAVTKSVASWIVSLALIGRGLRLLLDADLLPAVRVVAQGISALCRLLIPPSPTGQPRLKRCAARAHRHCSSRLLAAAADADLRPVPVLLDYHHLVQVRSANSALYVDLLAQSLDD